MRIIKYENSKGNSFYLDTNDVWIESCDFHKKSWKANSTAKKIGSKFDYYSLEERSYEVICMIKEKDKFTILDKIDEVAEYDIMKDTLGTLSIDDWSIQCGIIETETYKENLTTKLSMKIYCPVPLWSRETTRQFKIISGSTGEGGLNYPFNYDFNYTSSYIKASITNPLSYEADFRMIFYGPCEDPTVNIGENKYKVGCELEEGEYIVIDTKNSTIKKYDIVGAETNVFSLREPRDFFNKIESGENIITWDNSFGFDITIIEQKGEPKWS